MVLIGNATTNALLSLQLKRRLADYGWKVRRVPEVVGTGPTTYPDLPYAWRDAALAMGKVTLRHRTSPGAPAFRAPAGPRRLRAGRQSRRGRGGPYASPCVHRLIVQYRIRPEISGFVGGIFYNGALRTPQAVRGRRVNDQLPLHRAPLIHVDMASLAEPRRSDRRNLWLPFVVELLLEQVCTKDSSGPPPSLDVAVLTPLRWQASYPRNQLGQRCGAHFGPVHTAQG